LPAKNHLSKIGFGAFFGLKICSSFVLVTFRDRPFQEVTMDDTKQRELIRLWNLMRKAQGPVAEEIRIQILAQFERVQSRAA
jgi:hypothetical protein